MRSGLHKLLIVFLSVLVLSFSGCKGVRKVKDIKVTSVKIEAVSPQGLTALGVYLAVGIENPALQIGLEDIEGALKHSGKVLGRVTVDPFIIQARSAETYHLRAVVRIGEDATLRDLLMLTDMAQLYECTLDVSAKPRLKSGLAAPITVKDIPLKKLLEGN